MIRIIHNEDNVIRVQTNNIDNFQYIFKNGLNENIKINNEIHFEKVGIDIIKISFPNNNIPCHNMFNGMTDIISVEFINFTICNNTVYSMFLGCTSLKSVDLSTFNSTNIKVMTNMFCQCYLLETINFPTDFLKNVNETIFMFYECYSIKSIDFSNSRSTLIINMHGMFGICHSLESIKFPYYFDTSNVIEMSFMFQDCFNLKTLDLSIFKTHNVKNMDSMFAYCISLETLILSENFKTDNVNNMKEMFEGCYNLKSLDLQYFRTNKVTNMEKMFSLNTTKFNLAHDTSESIQILINQINDYYYNNPKLTSLDLSNFDTSNVSNMEKMFYGISSLESLQLSPSFKSNNLKNTSYMFYECSKLKSLDLTSFQSSKLIDMEYMFANCSSLENIQFSSSFDTSNVKYMKYIFNNCSKLKSLDLSSFNTNKVTSMERVFAQCSSLENIIFSNNFGVKEANSTEYMFYECSKLKSLDLTSFQSSKLIDMEYMFSKCSSLENINFSSSFDTSKVKFIKYIFNECSNLKSLDLSSFNTNNVTSMERVFAQCSSLENIIFSNNFGVKEANSTEYMFYECSKLKSLDLTSFQSSKLKNMEYMFANCSSLENINFSTSFDTKNVTNMRYMFNDCVKIKTLDLSSFNTNNVTNMEYMFYGSNLLEYLVLSNSFTMIKTTSYDNMFSNFCIEVISGHLNDKIINLLNSCPNVIEINVYSDNLTEELQFINYFIQNDDDNIINDIKMYVNEVKYDIKTNKITIDKENTKIKIKYPKDINISCDNMFKDIKNIKNIKFQNFNICYTSREMFSGCTSLEYINLTSFNINEIIDLYRLFSGCSSLETIDFPILNIDKSTNMDNMFCDCDKLTLINKSDFSSTAFTCKEQCYENKPYYIEDLNICVENCKNTEYEFTIIHNNNCTKKCPKDLLIFNFDCHKKCPIDRHKNEDNNYCECNYKYYIDENNITKCLNKEEQCNDTEYKTLIKNKNQCIKDCNDVEYKFNFNNICYNKCPNNTNFDQNSNKCKCLYKQYYIKDEVICLNKNEECPKDFSYYNFKSNECVSECPKDTFIFNKDCLINCSNNQIISENKCICKYKYYINNTLIYCLEDNEECPIDFPILYKENECLFECPENYFNFNNECLIECPENLYKFNLKCVDTCPNNYYKTKLKKCEIADNIEKDIDDNILLIHVNKYEEFIGNNLINIDGKNYNKFKIEIYDSNYLNNNYENNNSILNITECENLLKEKYNISKDEYLTIFKIDFYNEKSIIPNTKYKLYYKDKLLNLSYCDKVPISISSPVNLKNYGLDQNKLNDVLKYDIDIFNKNSTFYSDICILFSNSNKTDVTLKDRKKDYYINTSLCQEGCYYNDYNKITNQIKCICNIEMNYIKNDNINKIISNSNLKVLKCVYLYGKRKNFFHNYGTYIFLTSEFLLILICIKGCFTVFKLFKNLNINSNKNIDDIKSNNNFSKTKKLNLASTNKLKKTTNKKLNLKTNKIIIYKNITNDEISTIDSNNRFYTNKEKNNKINKTYGDDEINKLNFNESLLLDKRNFFVMYYSFLKNSHLIIFTFFTKTDFNLRNIKISLFIFSLIIYLTVNTLFFTDDSISHIYKKGRKFDFFYFLPIIIISYLICTIINIILKIVFLNQKDIKNINDINDENKKKFEFDKIIKYWKYKFIIFYILIFIFMSLFHIFVGTFCTIYKYTQKYLIINTIISFIVSIINPFIICIITTLLRKLSLLYRYKILFYISKILQ